MVSMEITSTSLPDVLIIEPSVFNDQRGIFMETYHLARYSEAGIEAVFVQDNQSHSVKGVLRGLHYQSCLRDVPSERLPVYENSK